MATNNSCDEATAASGKLVQAQGVGTANAFSTATYPSTATGTGKILRADGTNWSASTATYPDTAGSSSNVLTSDGTNWVSSSVSGGASYQGWLSIGTSGSPADSTTYYFVQNQAFTFNTSATLLSMRFYAVNAFTLNKVFAYFIVNGTLGSAENCTFFVRVNNTTNTNITTTLKLNTGTQTISNNSLGISLNAGDYFVFGFTGPAWATNPTNVGMALGWSS